MSWTFCTGLSKGRLINKLLAAGQGTQILEQIEQGNTLWTVQVREKDPCIVCYLIAQELNLWGYQELLEEDTPPLNCPLLLLELAPPVDRKWRRLVRAYHAKHRKRPRIEETWSLLHSHIPHIRITRISSSRVTGTYMHQTHSVKPTTLGTRLASWTLPPVATFRIAETR